MRGRKVAVSLVWCLAVFGLPVQVAGVEPSESPGNANPSAVPVLESPRPAERSVPAVEPGVPSSALRGRVAAAERQGGAAPVEELDQHRAADTRVFRNEDGSLTLDAYTTPIHYETASGWEPIDNTVGPIRGRDGWVGSSANAWTAAFGPVADGVELTAPGDVEVAFAPVVPDAGTGRASGMPRIDGGARRAPAATVAKQAERSAISEPGLVTYDDVWGDVDLRYEVRNSGLKEEILIPAADSPSEFAFDVSGATFEPDGAGGLSLQGPAAGMFRVPAPTVIGADGSDLTAASGARFVLSDPVEGRDARVAIVVDDGWLASQPESVFPVVVDPYFSWVNTTPTEAWSVHSGGSNFSGNPVAIGNSWRAAVRFGQYEPYLNQGYRVYSSFLYFIRQDSATTPTTPIELYEQGAQPTSWSQIGTGKPLIGTLQDPPAEWFDVLSVWTYNEMDRWATEGLTDQWFGLRGGTVGRQYDVRLNMELYQPPELSFVNNLSEAQVLSTTTPVLHAEPVPKKTDGGTAEPKVEFQITTSPAPGSGQVVSRWFQQFDSVNGVSWQVPDGVLQEGVTYWAWVLTDWVDNRGHIQPVHPPLSMARKFTVDLNLGEGGPSPTDEVGSVPGKAESPSEGAPSPALPGSKVTVNMVNGNLSLGLGTRSIETLSGPLALALTYNSLTLGNEGLRGEFFNDTNSSGDIDTGDVLVGERVDATVHHEFTYGTPVVAQDETEALARWTGFLTVPDSGTWQVGAISSDGLRVEIDGVERLDQWTPHDPQSTPGFGSEFTLTAGTPVPISIDWKSIDYGDSIAKVFLQHTSGANEPISLPPEWLTRSPGALPFGWALNTAAGVGRWVGLQDRGTSVAVFSGDGTAHEFTTDGNGAYTAPLTAPNDLLAPAEGGGFVLEDAAGTTYTFRPDGVLESIVTATDDLNPAALTYTYTGSPPRLNGITDPVSQRTVDLFYGGDPECVGAPPAAAGLLCAIDFWDGHATTLTYDTSGRLVRLTNPGDIIHDFAYDAEGRLTDVRDPLAVDAIAAAVIADDANARTQIAYDSDGRVASVTQPAPEPGKARPQRTYTYDPANGTGEVDVAGFAPSTGFAQQVTYDARNRIWKQTGADGLTTTYVWDDRDRLVATIDPSELATIRTFDDSSRPTVEYGPAPADWFDANLDPLPGYAIPATATEYDGGIDGLAATYWDNPDLAGGPDLHGTGTAAGAAMDVDWGATPPVTTGTGGWSARFAGRVELAAGDYEFQVETKGVSATVWVDGARVAHYDGPEPATGWATAAGDPVTLPGGRHQIQIDMSDTTGEAGLRVLSRPAGSGSFVPLPGAILDPDYGLVTQSTDPDGKVVGYEYADPTTGIGPHHRLQTATIADPGGLDLRTTVTYESPGSGSFLRRVARTLPAGNTTTTENYGGTEGPIAAVCGVGAGTAQAGFPKRVIDPDPDGSDPQPARVQEFVYDALGRQAARRVGDTATVGAAGWQCRHYDDRGRMTTESWSAHGTAQTRYRRYEYAVGGNPLVNYVSNGGILPKVQSEVDLLGRTVSYTDIWGTTTPTTFDQAGRQVSTEVNGFELDNTYDPANGRLDTVVFNGYTMSTNSYDAAGRLANAVYLNNSASIHTYDDYGRPDGLGIVNNQNRWAGEVIERSLAGRVMDETLSDPITQTNADPNPAGDNYTYDGAGRLVDASVTGASYTYGYGTGTGCTAPDAAKNTNRTNLTITGIGATSDSSCYDRADRLVSTGAVPASEIVYDDRGNNVRLGDLELEFDAADRHVGTVSPGSVVSLVRDPLDRIAQRTHVARIDHVATTTKTSSSASVSVGRPAGVQPGDLLVVAVSSKGLVTPGATASSGWTNVSQETSLLNRTAVLYRYATASDPSSWSFTSTNAGTSTAAIVAYRSTAPVAPVAVTNTASKTLATSHPVPNVTTVQDADLVIHATGLGSNVGMSTPSGTTQRAQVASGARLQVLDREQLDPGPLPGKTVSTGSAANSASVTVAFKPAVQVARYGYTGHNDASAFTLDGSGNYLGFSVPLPGGALYNWTPATGWEFSHADLHGDVIATTALSGQYTWYGLSGPYGEAASTSVPANTGPAETSLGWHGGDSKITDGGLVHMGARPYSPTHGRFLAVDPIEGGCANDYTYVHGDPINQSDLSGKEWWDPVDLAKAAWGYTKRCGPALGRFIFGGAIPLVGGTIVIVKGVFTTATGIGAPVGLAEIAVGVAGAAYGGETVLKEGGWLLDSSNGCLPSIS